MLLVAKVREELCRSFDLKQDKVENAGDMLPVSLFSYTCCYSARLQTVNAERKPWFYKLLKVFKAFIGCSVLVNKPIVCTLEDGL